MGLAGIGSGLPLRFGKPGLLEYLSETSNERKYYCKNRRSYNAKGPKEACRCRKSQTELLQIPRAVEDSSGGTHSPAVHRLCPASLPRLNYLSDHFPRLLFTLIVKLQHSLGPSTGDFP